MGETEGLVGTIVSITACPEIATGSGRVVVTTVSHLSAYLFDVTLAGQDATDVLGVTGYHRFYTEDRGWVTADQLALGEIVRTSNGDVTVASISRDDNVARVYNMTVEADHRYFVGDLTALVHNTCNGNSASSTRTSYLYQLQDKLGNLLKWGISQDPARRYTRAWLDEKGAEVVRMDVSGMRRMMLDFERLLVELKPGPMNNEPWAGAGL